MEGSEESGEKRQGNYLSFDDETDETDKQMCQAHSSYRLKGNWTRLPYPLLALPYTT